MVAFGPYVVEAELGRGAAGVVYRARGPAGEVVALKVLVPRQGDERQARRVAREVRVLERLRHPAIVAVRAAGEVRGGLWLAMDLVEGQTLQRRLDTAGPLPPREAAALALELARGLAHAHAAGVLHRDLKPDNVLLDRAGRPFLTDFGLAKDLEGTLHGASLSVSGQFMGTPGYWPPEQARGVRGAVGPASDVYALGATLFAALTGGPPHEVETLVEALAAAERPSPPPSSRNPDVPPALDAVVMRCLRPAVEERYPSADDLARALEAFLAAGRARRRPRRRWAPIAGLVAAGILGLIAAIVERDVPERGPAPVLPTSSGSAPAAEPLVGRPGELALLEVLREAKSRGIEVEDTAAFLGVFDALPPELANVDEVAGLRATTHLLRALERRAAGDPAWHGDAADAMAIARGRTSGLARFALARALSNLEEHDEALTLFAGLLDDPGGEDRGGIVRALLVACRDALPALRGSFLRQGAPTPHTARVVAVLERAAALEDRAVEAERVDALVALARAAAVHGDEGLARAALDRASATPRGRLARAEWRLSRGEVEGAADDLQAARGAGQELERVSALERVLEVERLPPAGDATATAAHLALEEVTGEDRWSEDVRAHLRRRRAAALVLPWPDHDRPLTPDELLRVKRYGQRAAEQRRLELFLALTAELPPLALMQPELKQLRAAGHVERADQLDAAGLDGRPDREAALALLAAPHDVAGRARPAHVLSTLERWKESLVEYGEALPLLPGLAELARERVLIIAQSARPATMGAFLQARPRLPRGDLVLDVLARLVPDGQPPSRERTAALVRLARALHASGDTDGAGAAMRRASAEGREDLDMVIARAEWHLGAGRLDEAAADLAIVGRRAGAKDERLVTVAGWLTRLVDATRARARGDATTCARLAQEVETDVRDAVEGTWADDLVAYARSLRA